MLVPDFFFICSTFLTVILWIWKFLVLFSIQLFKFPVNVEQYFPCKISAHNEWEKSWKRKSSSYQWTSDLLFSTAIRQRFWSGVTTLRWTILNPGVRIKSSRGAAYTTVRRISFSLRPRRFESRWLVLPPPPPHFCSHYTTCICFNEFLVFLVLPKFLQDSGVLAVGFKSIFYPVERFCVGGVV